MSLDINFVIPVRNGSQRVPNKNFRLFFKGKSLLEIKVEQLLEVVDKTLITINGDLGVAQNIASNYGVNFVCRSSELTSSQARPDDVWVDVASNYKSDSHMAYVLCNNPFFDVFSSAISKYEYLVEKGEYSGLASVSIVQKHLLDLDGNPLGFGFGRDWLPSEELKYLREINGGIQIGKVSNILKTRSLFGLRPHLVDFCCQSFEIDSLVEFENAKKFLESGK
jgi:CMP-N-acetylneuraminic acid synthetase